MLTSSLQNLQGTPWQERLLFLQQNTETYRWVTVGVIVGIYLIGSIIICVVGRKNFRMNVCALCFVPIINLVIIPWGIIKSIFGMLIGALSSSNQKPKKVKARKGTDDEFDLGLSDSSSEDEGIDLF